MIKRVVTGLFTSVMAISLIPVAAFAHVVVTPAQAGVAEELLFSVSVPNEEQDAVTNLKLTIPAGVTDVIPTTKEGWVITTKKDGDTVTSITWSDGMVPAGQRQDFTFSAQVPGKATDINWKAYQTYADGTLVHWDQKPAGSDDANGDAGPYSVTHVVNDLNPAPTKNTQSNSDVLAISLSAVAILLGVVSILMSRRR